MEANMSEIDVNLLLNQLSEDERIKLLSKVIGFKGKVVDIFTFLSDPYYLGNITGYNKHTGKFGIYDIWIERLKELYPNPITTKSSFVVNKGCIGSGKTTAGKLIILYDLYKFLMMKDPGGYFELLDKTVWFKIFNVTKAKAWDIVSELNDIIYGGKCPFFVDELNDPESNIHRVVIGAAGALRDLLSDDVISVILSELNFLSNWDFATELIDSCISRLEARFQKGLGIFNHIVLDSSDTTSDSPVETFLHTHPSAKKSCVWTTSIWQAKPHLYFKEGTFEVYAGDAKNKAKIIEDGEDLTGFDEDRILTVPMELHDQAEADIEKFLQEKAGISIKGTDQFFRPELLLKCFTLPNKVKEDIIIVDFFDPEDSLIPYFLEAINDLPKDRLIFGRLDLGLVNDRAGLAFGYIESLNKKNMDGVISYDPDIRVPIAVGISRKPGQETNIDKIADLVLYLHSKRPLFCFTTDTYQSSHLRQKLTIANIDNYPLSVDRTDEPYVAMKNMVYLKRAQIVQNQVLINEMANLKRVGGYIDHPQFLNAKGEVGSNSKDISDAVSGIIYSMTKADESAMDVPIIASSELQDSYISMLVELEKRNQEKYYRMNAGIY